MAKKTWHPKLTQKLLQLNYLYPFLKIKEFKPRKKVFEEVIPHYDPLAIMLLIIETITTSLSLTETVKLGVAKTELINKVQPFLIEIDRARGLDNTAEFHYQYIEEILHRLASRKAVQHKVEYVDFEDPNLAMRSFSFGILRTKTFQGKVYYSLDRKVIILFSTLGSDLDYEDEVLGSKLLLSHLIESGNLEKALINIRQLINKSLAYSNSLEEIIMSITRGYRSHTWVETQKEKLQNSEQHLQRWVLWKSELKVLLKKQFYDLDEINHPKEVYHIEQLKHKIDTLHQFFIKLLSKVQLTRQTFYNEHWKQTMFRSIEVPLRLEDLVLPEILKLPIAEIEEFEENLFPYYHSITMPKIHSVNNTVSYLLKGTQEEEEHVKIDELVDDKLLQFSEKFSQEVIKEVNDFFITYLKDLFRFSTRNLILEAQSILSYKALILLLLGLYFPDNTLQKRLFCSQVKFKFEKLNNFEVVLENSTTISGVELLFRSEENGRGN